MQEIESKMKEHRTVVIGINHLTASVSLRDKAYFNNEEKVSLSEQLIKESICSEVVIVSTCNRSEIYGVVDHENKQEVRDLLEKKWADLKDISEDELRKHSYFFNSQEAVTHLYNVVSSLDSLVVGENQILGQVKEAYEEAAKKDFVDFYFNYLFQASLRVGKRVRTETSLNEGAVSISYAAVELAKKVLGKKLEKKVVGVIGSGEMGELTAANFRSAGATKFVFFNRSLSSAERLATEYHGESYPLQALNEKLYLCDIVVSATGASETILHKSHVENAHKKRNGEVLFLIDIAAPSDMDQDIEDVSDTFLFSIDDLKKVVGDNVSLRKEASKNAKEIVDAEVVKVESWYRNLQLVPVIKKIRKKYDTLLEDELKKHKGNLPEDVVKEIERSCKSLLNKFMHIPISGLKDLGEMGQAQQAAHFAKVLFSLKENEEE